MSVPADWFEVEDTPKATAGDKPKELPACTEDKFKEKTPEWRKIILEKEKHRRS